MRVSDSFSLCTRGTISLPCSMYIHVHAYIYVSMRNQRCMSHCLCYIVIQFTSHSHSDIDPPITLLNFKYNYIAVVSIGMCTQVYRYLLYT